MPIQQTRATPANDDTSPRDARRLRWLALLAPFLAFLALAMWAVSSPVGSSPDDDFHLPSIWCGMGERDGLCETTGDPTTRLVPASIVGEPCYSRDATASAACFDEQRGEFAETDRVNVDGLYPPLFYATMSVFAGPDVVASVVAMRLFNAALFVGFLTATAWVVPVLLRRAVILPVIVTVVPLGMFIIPSTNASSWALLSAATLWASLYGASRATGKRRFTLLAFALVAGALGAGARADAAAFAGLAVVIVLILVMRRDRALVPVVATGVVVVVMAVLAFLTSRQSAAATEGLTVGNPPLSLGQNIDNLLGAPSLWLGMFGGWGLGWLDTPMPAAVSVLGFAVFAVTVTTALRSPSWREAAVIALTFAALWLVPVVLLWQSRALVGTYVQPRYILPLAVLLAGVTVLATRHSATRPLPTTLVVSASVALAFTNAIALHIELRRYTSGLDRLTVLPGTDAEWWWVSGPVWPVWIVGTAAYAGALVALQAFSVMSARAAAPRLSV